MSLAPSDSTQAMASLVSAYTDDDADDEMPVDNVNNVDIDAERNPNSPYTTTENAEHTFSHFISDDEDHPEASPSEQPPVNKRLNIAPDSTDQNTRSPSAHNYTPLERKPTLVSYAADDEADEDAEEGEDSTHSNESLPGIFGLVHSGMSRNTSSASVVVIRSEVEVPTIASIKSATSAAASSPFSSHNDDDILLPPEPTGSCSKRLQEKIAKYYERLRAGKDLNQEIQRRKDFRNPSIYEKLVEFCGVDEKGTNYPPELFNPLLWGPESFYDELSRVQMEYIHKKEKEANKSKVEFQKGIKKSAAAPTSTSATDNSSSSAVAEAKRKSKWDDRSAPTTAVPVKPK